MSQNEKPPSGRRFYTIHENESGTVDIYLRPQVIPESTQDGITDYDIEVLIVKDIIPYDGMEEDIRANYSRWCDSAEVVLL